MTIELTNIWKINNTLVVADSIEDAIVIYKTKYDNYPINYIEKVTNTGNGCAIINAPENLDSFIDRASRQLKEILIDLNLDEYGNKINFSLDMDDIEDLIKIFKEALKNDNR